MTEEEFFNEYQIICKGNDEKYAWIVINKTTNETRQFTINTDANTKADYELFTGKSFDEEAINSVAELIRDTYKLTE